MRKRIQKSMMFILIAILVPIYLIMSVGVYQRNLEILEGEIKQEASYIKRAVDLSGTEYLAQLDDVDHNVFLYFFRNKDRWRNRSCSLRMVT